MRRQARTFIKTFKVFKEMSWIFSKALCNQIIQDCANSPSLQALAADFSRANCLDGEPFVLSNGTNTPGMYLSHGKTTEALKLSRFGQTCKPLTADLGAELLMSYRADFHAKTSAQLERAQESTENAQACGATSQGSLAKYDPATHSLKTAQCSLLEDLTELSVTLPAWGMTRNGGVYLRPKSARIMGVTESGLLPDGLTYHHTPNTHGMDGMDGGSNSRKALAARQLPWATPTTMDKLPPKSETALMREMTVARPGRSQPANLRDQVSSSRNWPTPTANNYEQSDVDALLDRRERVKISTGNGNGFGLTLGNAVAIAAKYPTLCSTDYKGAGQSGDLGATYEAPTAAGQLNPNWVEWLMNWPIGWTCLEVLPKEKLNVPRVLPTSNRQASPRSHEAAGESFCMEKQRWWDIDPANLPVDHPDHTPRVGNNIKHRAARIKCIGNGQVPQCAATAWRILGGGQ